MTTQLKFTKMHGLGNDFIVFDGVRQQVQLTPERIRQLADRHFGIGCDQILLVEAARPPSTADFTYRIFNADGNEVEQCGNGARCFARFVHEHGLSDKTTIRVDTLGGTISLTLENNQQVSVNMGKPLFAPADIPFVGRGEPLDHCYPVQLDQQIYWPFVVNLGNPHAVFKVEDWASTPVQQLGAALSSHADFPEQVNVGFFECLAADEIRLRVYERGAGETLACGTGACAAVVCGIVRGFLQARVLVHTRGGDLTISWQGGDHPVMMTGPAVRVFEGEIEL